MNDKFVEAWTKLDETAKQIVKIKLTHPTASLAEIGRLMDPPVAKQNIHFHVSKKPEIQTCLDILEMDAVRGFQSLFPLALSSLRQSLMSPNPIVKLEAAKFTLKKISESDHVLPERIDDTDLEFVYNDLKEEANEKENDGKGTVSLGQQSPGQEIQNKENPIEPAQSQKEKVNGEIKTEAETKR